MTDARRRPSRSWLLVAIAVAIALSTLVAGVQLARAVRGAILVNEYIETSGQVTVSELRRSHRSSRLQFVARYEVDGTAHFVYPTFGNPDGLDDAAVVARYPPGSTVRVYYDPGDPENALLSRNVPFVKWLLLFVAMGALAVAAWMFLRR